MSIDFILGVLVGIAISIIIGNVLLTIANSRVDKQIEKLFQELKETTDNIAVPVRVESHNGIFFLYRIKDNTFLTQGADLAEIRENVQIIAKDMHVYVAEGDDDVIQALKNTDTKLETNSV
jgi:MFS superfamily sulfate permease-like transporter